ncbi:MAG: YcxB family protein [Spirochaetales bacterium]|nr:YcxB family protein [Spirochaetales bacterium]
MEFSFQYKVRPGNLLILGLANTYRSMAGLVNLIFTISMILLAVRFWTDGSRDVKILIVAGILLFPLVQPLFIYMRSRKIVASIPDGLEMKIDGSGIRVISEKSSTLIPFSDLISVKRVGEILILYTGTKQSFVLNKQTLGGQGQELYDFLSARKDAKK